MDIRDGDIGRPKSHIQPRSCVTFPPAFTPETAPLLPTARELHRALCISSATEPLCERVFALRELYHRRREEPFAIYDLTNQHSLLLRDIVNQLTHRLAWAYPTLTSPQAFAELIDHMAATADHALYLLETLGGADPRTHGVWTSLAELELGYTDMCGEVGRRWSSSPAA